MNFESKIPYVNTTVFVKKFDVTQDSCIDPDYGPMSNKEFKFFRRYHVTKVKTYYFVEAALLLINKHQENILLNAKHKSDYERAINVIIEKIRVKIHNLYSETKRYIRAKRVDFERITEYEFNKLPTWGEKKYKMDLQNAFEEVETNVNECIKDISPEIEIGEIGWAEYL